MTDNVDKPNASFRYVMMTSYRIIEKPTGPNEVIEDQHHVGVIYDKAPDIFQIVASFRSRDRAESYADIEQMGVDDDPTVDLGGHAFIPSSPEPTLPGKPEIPVSESPTDRPWRASSPPSATPVAQDQLAHPEPSLGPSSHKFAENRGLTESHRQAVSDGMRRANQNGPRQKLAEQEIERRTQAALAAIIQLDAEGSPTSYATIAKLCGVPAGSLHDPVYRLIARGLVRILKRGKEISSAELRERGSIRLVKPSPIGSTVIDETPAPPTHTTGLPLPEPAAAPGPLKDPTPKTSATNARADNPLSHTPHFFSGNGAREKSGNISGNSAAETIPSGLVEVLSPTEEHAGAVVSWHLDEVMRVATELDTRKMKLSHDTIFGRSKLSMNEIIVAVRELTVAGRLATLPVTEGNKKLIAKRGSLVVMKQRTRIEGPSVKSVPKMVMDQPSKKQSAFTVIGYTGKTDDDKDVGTPAKNEFQPHGQFAGMMSEEARFAALVRQGASTVMIAKNFGITIEEATRRAREVEGR